MNQKFHTEEFDPNCPFCQAGHKPRKIRIGIIDGQQVILPKSLSEKIDKVEKSLDMIKKLCCDICGEMMEFDVNIDLSGGWLAVCNKCVPNKEE